MINRWTGHPIILFALISSCSLFFSCDPDAGSRFSHMTGEYLLDNNALDTSSSPHYESPHGLLIGAAWPEVSISNRFGQSEKAIALDGIDDYLLMPSLGAIMGRVNWSYAISFWVRFDDTITTGSRIMSTVDTGAADTKYAFDIYVNELYSISVGNKDDAMDASLLDSTTSLADDLWHHVVYFNTGGESWMHYLYIDTNLVASGPVFLDSTDMYSHIHFGAWLNGGVTGFYNGCLDDVRFFEGLTEGEIALLYNETAGL